MAILSPALSNHLNFFRWFAAFLVVIGHLRSLIYPEYVLINSPSIFEKFFYFITGLGHQAVIIFFVLSGFLVGGEFLRITHTKKDYTLYLIKRFTRIFTVFIPALVIGGFIDYIGIKYFNSLGIYANVYHFSAMNYSVIERLNILTFISNLFMMQTSVTPTFVSNGPLWSLANEWWYYLLFPSLVILSHAIKIKYKLSIAMFLIVLLTILNNQIILYFSIWMLGALAAYKHKKIYIPYISYISYIMLIISLIISRGNILHNSFLQDIIIACALIFLINNLYFQSYTIRQSIKINRYLADFSYSLYLFHFPFAVILINYFYTIDYSNNTKLTLLIISIYVYSIFMYNLFEKQTSAIKVYLVRKVSKK